MIGVNAPRFDLDECNNERERDFIESLHARAEAGGWFADSWPREDRFMLSVCPSDPQYGCVLRTLRVDFDGVAVSFGPDETHQFATDLDPARADVVVLRTAIGRASLRGCDLAGEGDAPADRPRLVESADLPPERMALGGYRRGAHRQRLGQHPTAGRVGATG